MHQILQNYMSWLLNQLTAKDIILIDSRSIPYGQQLKLSSHRSEISVNIYYSKSKGISVVLGGNKKSDLYNEISQITGIRQVTDNINHKWKRWVGTDESGKGDFFGPLVVCGFVMEKKMQDKFREMGIMDSKKISAAKITEFAAYLYRHYRKNIEIVILNPAKYNELYTKFRDQNRKLNELLAWMHGRVILNLKKREDFEGALIDKFANERTLKESLKELNEVSLIQRVRAEDDLAVACASIVARDKFNQAIDKLSDKYKMKFPKGASQSVIETAKKFSVEFGKERLREVAKIHFKTCESR
jgi:ribonuclease HIII